ncbi:hypothetical protein [Pseudomonas sp.]|uniref:hypothetical protein n=1 Tax=Pseudomonas sp. TaxID=306 RepID=UPI0028AB21CE|nr:hypothetical protein [Pseudomonas sp.]
MTDIAFADRFLDAVIDGHLGSGLVITRQELISFFPEDPETTTGCFLSNSEISSATHSPTYRKMTLRVSPGVYRVHPEALLERMKQRGIAA